MMPFRSWQARRFASWMRDSWNPASGHFSVRQAVVSSATVLAGATMQSLAEADHTLLGSPSLAELPSARARSRVQPLHAPSPDPVFVVGNPRSGTTYFHDLLSLDEENFHPVRLRHTLMPSPNLVKLLRLTYRAQTALTGRSLDPFPHLFSMWKGIHRIGFDKPEEDVWVWMMMASSPALMLLFPFQADPSRLGELDDLDERTQEELLSSWDRFHAVVRAEDTAHRRLLNKTVFSMGRVRTLSRRYPEARFLYLLRDPVKAIPSYLSKCHHFWVLMYPDLPRDGHPTENVYRWLVRSYRKLDENRQLIEDGRLTVLPYRHLKADPVGTIESLYRELDLPLGSAFRQRLEERVAAEKSFSSPHRYQLEDFGLTEERIRRDLGFVYDLLDESSEAAS